MEGDLRYEQYKELFISKKQRKSCFPSYVPFKLYIWQSLIFMIHMVTHLFILFVILFRHRKDELERRMSALQESRRELMVQLEGLMRLLKVRNLLDKNLALHFPWHVWQHHLFSHSILTFFLSTSFSTTSVFGVSAFTHYHLSSSGWQDEEQKQAVSVPLLQLKHSGVNTLGHRCKGLS